MKFRVPPEVEEHIPPGCKIDLKTYLTMDYVAKAVSKEGSPFEFRLKIHPQNDKLPFLDSKHQLHSCYRFLEKNPYFHLYNYDKDRVPELLHDLYKHIFKDRESSPLPPEPKGETLIEGYSDSD